MNKIIIKLNKKKGKYNIKVSKRCYSKDKTLKAVTNMLFDEINKNLEVK